MRLESETVSQSRSTLHTGRHVADHPQTKLCLPNLELPHPTPDSHEAIGLLRAFRPATSGPEGQGSTACSDPARAELLAAAGRRPHIRHIFRSLL